MIRADMISTVGRAYLTSNIEKMDIRFVKDNLSVLIETKQTFARWMNILIFILAYSALSHEQTCETFLHNRT